MLDVILYAIVAAFIAWEGIAHFLLHNMAGHTLSNRIGVLETNAKYGTLARIAVAISLLALGIHLELSP